MKTTATKLKGFVILMSLLFVSSIITAQPWDEDFDETGWGASYGNYTLSSGYKVGNSYRETMYTYGGSTAACRIDSRDTPVENNYIESPAVTSVGNVSFYYRHWDGDANTLEYKLMKSEDGIIWTDVTTVCSDFNSTTYTLFTYDVDDADAQYIRLEHVSGSERFIVDDFSITEYSGATPEIVLADNGTQVSAGNAWQGETNHFLSTFTLAVTDANATLTNADIDFDGTYTAGDIVSSGLKLWYNSSNDFGTASELDAQTAAGSGGSGETVSFSSLSQTINSGNTGYFWVTCDIDVAATLGNDIQVLSIDHTDLTFSSGNTSGSTTAGGLQTIIAPPQVDWCNLQWPTSSSITVGTAYNVYARVYEPGVTDAGGQGAGITAWIGYSYVDNDPSANPGDWTWVTATYNADTDGNSNDEYIADIGTALPSGNYYYCSRFQLNGGPYSYGGYNSGGGGFWDGSTNVSQRVSIDAPDWCNLHFPEDGTIDEGNSFDVYAQIYEPGVTDAAGQGANVNAWIGYSTVDNDPEANPGDWAWAAASYNTDAGNNDEYTADLGTAIGSAGTYYYASRFQYNSGAYTYGGFNGGFWTNTYTDGTGNKSGRLIINANLPNAWINEIHYDDDGADANEMIEVVVENPGSYALSDFQVNLYNGSDGGTYDSQTLDNFVVGDVSGTATIYTWAPPSIQNGAPDGMALSYQGTLIQFLSYEGTFAATDGPANGETSVDIGVSEDGSGSDTESLQLSGNGCAYADFTWQTSAANTMGSANNSQILCLSGDYDSQASIPDLGQEPGTSISSLADTDPEAVDVFKFDIDDLGTSDGLATIVTNIRIKPHTTNTADWTDHIQGVKLDAGGTVTTGVPTIDDTYIDIPISAGDLNIADGTSTEVTLSVYVNTSNIVDGSILSFCIDADDHNFTADASGSVFASTLPAGDVVSNDFTIEVIATELRYAQQPSSTGINNCMSPDVAVEATDENGNRDSDFTSDIRITSTGSLVGSPVDVTALNGLATFDGADCIQHDALGSNLTLNAERALTEDWDITSNQFDINNSCATELFFSEYVEGSSNNKFLEIFNGIGNTANLADYEIRHYNNGDASPTYSLALSGTLDDGNTFVIENDAEDLGVSADLSTSSNVMTFNGDDALELYNTNTSSSVDVIGQIGTDPGSQWGTDPISTENNTIRRKADITGGDTNGGDVFDPSLEWDGYAEDDVSGLGTHTINCICEEPTVDASDITFPDKSSTSIDLSWTSGDGTKRIVVCREGAAVNFTPVDGVTYSADADYSTAVEVGTPGQGNKVVYDNTGNSFSLTGLTPGMRYYFKIFEYNCSPTNEDYLTSGTPAEADTTTSPENIQNFTLSCITNTTAELTWDLPQGSFDGILIAVRESTLSPSDPSCDGSTLTAPDTDFSTALVYCGNGTDSRYVYNASGTSVTITGLSADADYVFKAFTWNETDWTSGTQRSGNASLNDVADESTFISNQQIRVSWTNPTTCYDEIMIIGKQGGSPTVSPSGDGSLYTANSAFGTGGSGANLPADEYCVYKGVNTSVDVTNVTNGSSYCFKIFVREGTEWSQGIEICDTPADISVFTPGDLIFIGYDTKTSDNGCGGPVATDVFFILTMVDIKPGTSFGLLNASYEYGAAAYERSEKFWSCTSTPGQFEPGRVEISWDGGSNISAGSIIEVFLSPTAAATYFEVDGVDQTANFSSSGSFTNIAENDPDQMWIYQGTINDYGSAAPDYYSTINGNILYGLSNQAAWVPVSDPVSVVRTSRRHPDIECFNMDFSGDVPVNYYQTTASHSGSKRELLGNIMNQANWTVAVNSDCNDIPPAVGTTTFTVNAGLAGGTWRGDLDNDWFNCGNWEDLTVPDQEVDVTISSAATITNSPDIDQTSSEASKFNNIAECNDLLIDDDVLTIDGSYLDTLYVYGDLTVQNSGTLDMQDGTGTDDGVLAISGDWNNTASFDEGDGTVIFNGADAQIMNSTSVFSFNNLILNNINLSGVTINNDLTVNDTLSQSDNLLNLNSYDLALNGVYLNTGSCFEGDAGSNLSITGTGGLDAFSFMNDINLNNFSINRNGESAIFNTGLYVNGNLTITDGAVEFSAANDYTVDGSIVNTPGTADALILRSDASGTASLIQNAGAVPATVERFTTGNNWHFLFAPLSQIDTSVYSQAPWGDNNPNFYWYDEPVADFWSGTTVYNPTGWTDISAIASQNMQTDRGYLHYFITDYTFIQTGGNLEVNDKNFTLSYTDNGDGIEPVTGLDWNNFEGWNLIGNPYASAIDWDAIWADIVANGQDGYVENGIYYYDDVNDNYVFYGGGTMYDQGITVNGSGDSDNAFIPSNQGVFVKATETGHGNDITVESDTRIHGTETFWKKSEREYTDLLRFRIEKEAYTDETVIRMLPEATDDHDIHFDAYKMFAWSNDKPQIFTCTSENSCLFALNSFAPVDELKTIPVGVRIEEEGIYIIRFTENYFSGMHVWFEDVLLGNTLNLLDHDVYQFTQSAENNEDRFFIHFGENNAPVLNYEIPDQETYVGEYYSYDVPEDVFIDTDFEDELSYTASLENGDDLPAWLSFDHETMQFLGTPAEIQTINIMITATDIFGAQSSDVFVLNVKSSVSVSELKKPPFDVYPNPTDGLIFIEKNSDDKVPVIITNQTGKIVKELYLSGRKSEIDLSDCSKGLYIIKAETAGRVYYHKVILK